MHALLAASLLWAACDSTDYKKTESSAAASDAHAVAPETKSSASLAGQWVRKAEGMDIEEGYELQADGKMNFINMASIIGEAWQQAGDTLTIYHHTERYPQRDSSRYQIVQLTDSTLELKLHGAAVTTTEKLKRKK